jgi:hypothetical protein
MWTPPLRESFGYPLSLLQILLVSWTLNSKNLNWKKLLMISVATTMYLMSWQFAQFTLFTQVCVIFAIHSLGLVQTDNVNIIIGGLMVRFKLILWLTVYRCHYFTWRQNSTDLNFPHFFRQLSLKMFGRQQWTLFADFLLTR